MKKILIISLLLFAINLNGQDYIILTNRDKIKSKVSEIFIDEIYKRKLSNNGMIPSNIRLY